MCEVSRHVTRSFTSHDVFCPVGHNYTTFYLLKTVGYKYRLFFNPVSTSPDVKLYVTYLDFFGDRHLINETNKISPSRSIKKSTSKLEHFYYIKIFITENAGMLFLTGFCGDRHLIKWTFNKVLRRLTCGYCF